MKTKNIIKVLILSDTTKGGAAVSCKRLLRSVEKYVHDIDISICSYRGEVEDKITIASDWDDLFGFLSYRIYCAINASDSSTESSLYKLAAKTMLKVVCRTKPDILNIHNIHGSTDFSLLAKLPMQIPIIWTLHDMWALTGYCCYSGSCKKFIEGCTGECPEMGNYGTSIKSPDEEWLGRQKFFDSNLHRITFVTPSKWLSNCVVARFSEAAVECIPYSLNLSMFNSSLSRKTAREALGLSQSKKTILFGADSIGDKRKGLDLLVDALKLVSNRFLGEIQMVCFGGNREKFTVSDNWVFAGAIKDERLLNMYYRAADVYVLPTRADNLPNTLLEATASGTPSVVFDVGGCAEVVENGVTGYVVAPEDSEMLADAIMRLLDLDVLMVKDMSAACRNRAEKMYSEELQAFRYNKLVQEILIK